MIKTQSEIVTRFAPSPTGFLHIGGARTALFNWLFTRGNGGKFLLRIEDTDRARSSAAAVDAIIEGLTWLGLNWDGEPVFQFERQPRHAEVAAEMLAAGHAYHCYASKEELQEMRDTARREKRPMRYDGRWRDRDPDEAPKGVPPVVRLRASRTGETVIEDKVQGRVVVPNSELDDMILLRSDGTPTYMLSVVVDDHDMGITHVIRGDDHLTNAFRQAQIYSAMKWPTPEFAHIPLIHGADGAKLSKRHGALGVDAYAEMGFMAEAMRNYLTRLGWGHGDNEIFSSNQAQSWFTLEAVGKAPARFDLKKLENLNAHYIRDANNPTLVELVEPLINDELGRPLTADDLALLERAMPGLKDRSKTLVELSQSALFYFRQRPLEMDEKATRVLDGDAPGLLGGLADSLDELADWNEEALEALVREFADREGLKLGKIAQPMRAALTGKTVSPSIFEILVVLGKPESLARLGDQSS